MGRCLYDEIKMLKVKALNGQVQVRGMERIVQRYAKFLRRCGAKVLSVAQDGNYAQRLFDFATYQPWTEHRQLVCVVLDDDALCGHDQCHELRDIFRDRLERLRSFVKRTQFADDEEVVVIYASPYRRSTMEYLVSDFRRGWRVLL